MKSPDYLVLNPIHVLYDGLPKQQKFIKNKDRNGFVVLIILHRNWIRYIKTT